MARKRRYPTHAIELFIKKYAGDLTAYQVQELTGVSAQTLYSTYKRALPVSAIDVNTLDALRKVSHCDSLDVTYKRLKDLEKVAKQNAIKWELTQGTTLEGNTQVINKGEL